VSGGRAHKRFLGTHRCPIVGCEQVLPKRMVLCLDDWQLVPRYLQARLIEQQQYGIAWKCHPTDQFLDARREALRIVNEERARRHSRPQLPLFSPT
jgi:hypothetical protein